MTETLPYPLTYPQTYEDQLHFIREYVHDEQKIILNNFLNKTTPLATLFEKNTLLAEQSLEKACGIALAEISQKALLPQGGFVIIAMGKFGGRELNFFSDLDLMFFYENPEDFEYYSLFVRRLITTLSVVTQDGYAYQIDTELRPSGNSGMLLSTLKSWKEYAAKGIQLWEKQSLLKARPLLILSQPHPSPTFHYDVLQTIDSIRYQQLQPSESISHDLYSMRLRIQNELAREKNNLFNIKTGYGGLIDIEFLTQYLQMLHAHQYQDLRTTNTLEALNQLGRLKILSVEDVKTLSRIYIYYRELEAYFRITLLKSTDEIRSPSEVTYQVEEKYYQGKKILETYLPTREIVRSIYIKVLGVKL